MKWNTFRLVLTGNLFRLEWVDRMIRYMKWRWNWHRLEQYYFAFPFVPEIQIHSIVECRAWTKSTSWTLSHFSLQNPLSVDDQAQPKCPLSWHVVVAHSFMFESCLLQDLVPSPSKYSRDGPATQAINPWFTNSSKDTNGMDFLSITQIWVVNHV